MSRTLTRTSGATRPLIKDALWLWFAPYRVRYVRQGDVHLADLALSADLLVSPELLLIVCPTVAELARAASSPAETRLSSELRVLDLVAHSSHIVFDGCVFAVVPIDDLPYQGRPFVVPPHPPPVVAGEVLTRPPLIVDAVTREMAASELDVRGFGPPAAKLSALLFPYSLADLGAPPRDAYRSDDGRATGSHTWNGE
jgi:hypothetical protein